MRLHGSVPLLCILRDISLQRLTDTGVTWFGYKQLHFNILEPGDTYTIWIVNSSTVCDMGLLPDTKIAGCACAGNAGNVFPDTEFKGNQWLAIPTCITARSWRTCLDACRDHWPAVLGKTFPVFPAHAQPTLLRIWQEAHGSKATNHKRSHTYMWVTRTLTFEFGIVSKDRVTCVQIVIWIW